MKSNRTAFGVPFRGDPRNAILKERTFKRAIVRRAPAVGAASLNVRYLRARTGVRHGRYAGVDPPDNLVAAVARDRAACLDAPAVVTPDIPRSVKMW